MPANEHGLPWCQTDPADLNHRWVHMSRPHIIILGGSGNTGRMIAELLLQQADVDLTLAGRRLAKVQAVADELRQKHENRQISAIQVDAGDLAGLEKAFARADFVVVSSSTIEHTRFVAEAALKAGIGYFDHQPTSRDKIATLKSLKTRIIEAGCCFITEGGVIPGLPAMLVRYLAPRFDRLESAQVAFVMQDDKAPSPETLIELKTQWKQYQPLVFKQGTWQLAEQMVEFDFTESFGTKPCMACYLDELESLPKEIASLREVGFYIGALASNWFMRWVARPITSLIPTRSLGFRRLSARLLSWGIRFNPPPYLMMIMVEGRGWCNGESVFMRLRLSHPSSYFVTAASSVACLLQYLSQDIPPGLWYQADAVDDERMLSDLQRLGVKVEIETVASH
jgi:hypothetical protein